MFTYWAHSLTQCVHMYCTLVHHIFNVHWNMKPKTKPCLRDITPVYTAVRSLWAADDIPSSSCLTQPLLQDFHMHGKGCCTLAGVYMRPLCCTKSSRELVSCHPVSWISLHFHWGESKSSNAFPPIWWTPLAVWQRHRHIFQIDNGMRKKRRIGIKVSIYAMMKLLLCVSFPRRQSTLAEGDSS